MVQESPGLKLDCFGDIKLFSGRGGVNCKVTDQTLYSKPEGEKLFIYCLSLFLNVGATFAFFHSDGNLPERKQFWKIISSGLYMEMSQCFIMQMLIMSWPWALLGSRFFIILYISSFEKIMWYLKCYYVWNMYWAKY